MQSTLYQENKVIIIDKGHRYKLFTLDGVVNVELIFVKRFRGTDNHAGTTNQEVLKCLIDRVQVLDAENPHSINTKILGHLRMALVAHKSRALERKVEKGELNPETIQTSSKDGHFKLKCEEFL